MSTARRVGRLVTCGASVAATLAFGFVWLALARAQSAPQPKRFVWRGTIDDERAYVGRAVSGGGVARMPNPFIFAYQIHVDFEFVQEFDANGVGRFTRRHMSWSLQGSENDTAAYTRQCKGGGSLELGASSREDVLSGEQTASLKADCQTSNLVPNFRINEIVPTSPPMPHIPAVSQLDEGCSYREERGTRRTNVWLAPEVDALVNMDEQDGSSSPGEAVKAEYAKFVPQPGHTLVITAATKPSFPARFRFVIDKGHTSNFAGYAGNASIDDAFFKRYRLEHLAGSYTDQSPDLIFDPAWFDAKTWSVISQDVVETAEESSSATASVTAMDYGAVGQVKAYVKYKCGGWSPVPVRVNGQERDAVSVPLDEDHNLMADPLEDYRGLSPESDDDAEPEGDGTKGDGLTAFEEYRGFLVEGWDCKDPVTDAYLRTSPKKKNLFVYASNAFTNLTIHSRFAWASGIDTETVCARHLYGTDDVVKAVGAVGTRRSETVSVPDDTRVVNFTLQRANQRTFDGHTVSQQSPQHGIVVVPVRQDSGLLGLGAAQTISVRSYTDLGPPRFTAAIVFQPGMEDSVIHEMGHAVGLPHHSDTRRDWKIVGGIDDLRPALAYAQRTGLAPDSVEAEAAPAVQEPDGLLVMPGPGCAETDQGTHAYLNGAFVGCAASNIYRRGQQTSGDVECPMRYSAWADPLRFHEPPGVKAQFLENKTVLLNSPKIPDDVKPTRGRTAEEEALILYGFSLDEWSGPLLRGGDPENYTGPTGQFCAEIRGTGVNTGTLNIAGDAGRPDACRSFMVVNDLAPRDPK